MNIDELIKDSFENLIKDFIMRKSYFLNKLHYNIDELVKNSHSWFKDDVPREFSNILSSLMNLSVSFYDEIDHFKNILSEKNYTVFDPAKIFDQLEISDNEIKKILNIEKKDSEILINTSYNTLYDSIHSIFICMQQFFTKTSNCYVSFKKENTSIKTIISFKDLKYTSNELNKLTKVFFSYNNDDKMELRVGMRIPIENIKSIGGIINIYESNNYKDLTTKISFPSNDFLETVKDIRKLYSVSKKSKTDKTIIISIDDKIMEMILRDTFEDSGYETIIVDIDRIHLEIDKTREYIVILDTSNILKNFSSINEFDKMNDINSRKLIIKDDDSNEEIHIENTEIICLPFEIDEIMEKF